MHHLKFAPVLFLLTLAVACGADDKPAEPTTGSAGTGGSAAAAGSGGAGQGGSVTHGGSTGGTHSMGGSGTDMGGSSGAQTGGASGAAGSAGDPVAPVMKSVGPLEGGLHIIWTNMTPDCDKIELLRNKDGGDFSVAFTLPAIATEQHDATAAGASTYCYKARCIKGTKKSPESNEKCGKP